MKKLEEFFNKNSERCMVRAIQTKKMIYQYFYGENIPQKKILFIVGCQRSGTTLMTRIFEKDKRTWVYGEYSRLSSLDTKYKIRLNPPDHISRIIEKKKVSLVVIKPLVESQNILKLLSYFDTSKALWMFRNYKNVSRSNLEHWGLHNGINNLRAIVKNEPNNWRSENVSAYTKSIINRYYSEDMNPYDAAALFWFVRNKLFFELGLDENPRIMMCKYEDLITSPLEIMQHIYVFLEFDYPDNGILDGIHTNDIEKGKAVELSPEIEKLCKDLLDKLNVVYQEKCDYSPSSPNETLL